MFKIFGDSESEDEPPLLEGFQAIHSNADGDGRRGPVRDSDSHALADADEYADRFGIHPDEIFVLALYPGMNTARQLPPNPLAERPLEQIITLDSLCGYWSLDDPTDQTNDAEYFLDIRIDGQCKTDYGARFIDEPFDGFDVIEVLSKSSFVLAITGGEDYVFAVTRFDGDEMDLLLGGWKQCPYSMRRRPHPSGLKIAKP